MIAWAVVGLWLLVLLASARPTLRRLPAASEVVPPYQLWLPDGGEAPTLDPEPVRVVTGAAPTDGPERIIALRVRDVPPDLPGRLAACGADFVSVCPHPRGGPLALSIERLHRDVANPINVTDPTHPGGYADDRCAWLRRADLDLPAPGDVSLPRAARARKAHGLRVDLRAGRGVVSAPARGLRGHRAQLDGLTGHDPLARLFLVGLSLTLNVTPFALLLGEGSRTLALLALGLGSAARGMTALREGFGASLTLLGWVTEPVVALASLGAPRAPAAPFPTLPATAPPELTSAQHTDAGGWLDNAAVPFLARRLGGSAPVMAQIYGNLPAGRTFVGRMIDRIVHASSASRSVRHRYLSIADAARRQRPERLLSVPCGSAADARLVGAPDMVLVDPDPAARALAAASCPAAVVVDGTVEHCPAGPFDVIIYAGLAEYLDDAEVVRHLQYLRARMTDLGALITSTTAEHPERARMSRWLGWQTRARTPDALAILLDAAGFVIAARTSDPLGIQWVFTAHPRPSE